jgi:hypothetical protein
MGELEEHVVNIPDDIGGRLGTPPLRGGHEHRVDEILPAGYPAYLRLFHPFLPWGNREPPRVTWRELAARAGVAYGPMLTWRQLEPVLPLRNDARPYMVLSGELDVATATYLFSALAAVTGRVTTFYRYDLGALLSIQRTLAFKSGGLASPEALRSAVRDVAGQPLVGPEWVWPEGRAWVVHSDYDLESTYIAADEDLAAVLLAHPELEIVRVSLDTRVDARADEEPGPRAPPAHLP